MITPPYLIFALIMIPARYFNNAGIFYLLFYYINIIFIIENISLEIPKEKLVVITGLSGSGKSSLAFDTIYAEGQRRYVESLSA